MAKKPKLVRKKTKEVLDRKKTREPKTSNGKASGSQARPGYISRRRKHNSVRPGMQLGDLYVCQRVATKQGSSGGQKWLCECSCGKRITIPQWYLVRKEFPKRHCGCKAKGKIYAHTRERGIFYMMHRRCYNETHVAYKHYGGAERPIRVCDSWNKDVVGGDLAWENFIKDMGPAPSKGHTLDRIDPYNGYGWWPDLITGEIRLNCRWATASEQMNNLKRHWASPEERQAKLEAERFDVEVDSDTDIDPDTDVIDEGEVT